MHIWSKIRGNIWCVSGVSALTHTERLPKPEFSLLERGRTLTLTMVTRFYLILFLFLRGTLVRADSLATLTVTVPEVKGTYTVFEVYERNKFDRIIARAECGHEISLAPDRYNVRILEESRRGLREIWLYDIHAHGAVRLKARFGTPTVRVRIVDHASVELPHTVVFKSKKKHRTSHPVPFNIYTRIPTGKYTVEVIKENRVVSTTDITLERELDGVLNDNLRIEWVVE